MKDIRGRKIEVGDTIAYVPTGQKANVPFIVLAEVTGFDKKWLLLSYKQKNWELDSETGKYVEDERIVNRKTSMPERVVIVQKQESWITQLSGTSELPPTPTILENASLGHQGIDSLPTSSEAICDSEPLPDGQQHGDSSGGISARF